ncbi:MAG: FeoA family protein [Clostridia bacterium]|nr:FeoA family protein [Clostridia bacterium]
MILKDLRAGTKGSVIALSATGLIRRRLLDLGLVPGTEVTAVRRSPLGDPIAFLIRGAVIALRGEDAACITVGDIREVEAVVRCEREVARQTRAQCVQDGMQ